MNEILKQIEKFHGHVGPYVLIGYRMGKIANEKLGKDPFCKNVIVSTGTNPPLSCIVDGIQMSSGCTLGKGNINVISEGIPKALFTSKDNGNKVVVLLKNSIKDEIDTNVTEKNMISFTEKLFEKSDEELFEIF